MNKFLMWFGLLSALLMLLAYFRGSTAFAGAIGTMIQTISYAMTGRNAQGNFADYPK